MTAPHNGQDKSKGNSPRRTKIHLRQVCFSFGTTPILDKINIDIPENHITAITGPSGQGKSTLLSCINRLWEETPGARMTGGVEIRFNGRFQNIGTLPAHDLRRKVGTVFQVPTPLPMSIYKNVAFPLKLQGKDKGTGARHQVEEALKRTHLWGEVKDRLDQDARALSGGQQQRLCMARALVLRPRILLLDEPTSSLDPAAGEHIEALLTELKSQCTLVLISHYMDQVARIADQRLTLEQGRITQNRHSPLPKKL